MFDVDRGVDDNKSGEERLEDLFKSVTSVTAKEQLVKTLR